MNGERPDLPRTIAALVRSARPVTSLQAPSLRLARWSTASVALAALTVVLLGPRPDASAQIVDGWFVARASALLATALCAAFVALSMSVPGIEPSPCTRALPFYAGGIWAAILAVAIGATGSPLERLFHVSPHPSCVLFIVAIAVVPGLVLVRMLRQAAPLQPRHTAALAVLASASVGAFGAQFVCRNDAAAHHVVWHLTPVVLLTAASASFGAGLLRPPVLRIRPR